MEFERVVRRRRMVRDYDPGRPVPSEAVDHLLDLAVRAPSAGFSQGWAFLVLDSREDVDRFWAAARPPTDEPPDRWLTGMRRAPVIIVPLSNRDIYLDRYARPDKGRVGRDERGWPVPYWHIDTGFASLLMLLGAVDGGLGACFFGIPGETVATFRGAFDVPVEYTPIGAITIGYPAVDRRSPSLKVRRRSVTEVVHRGRFGVSTT